MSIKYYYSENGELKGPFLKHELVGKPITRDTLVWVEGMASWQPASEVPMFADILDGTFRANQSQPPVNPTQSPYASMRQSPVNTMPNEASAPRVTTESTQQFSPTQDVPYNHAPYMPQNGGQPQRENTSGNTTHVNSQNTSYIAPGQNRPTPGYGNTNQQPYTDQQPQPAYQQQTVYQQPTYQQQPMYQQQPPAYTPQGTIGGMQMPSNQLGWTLTGTILSGMAVLTVFAGFFPSLIFCIPLILGIIGISKGSSVQSFWMARRVEDAIQASKQAKLMGIWSVVTFVVLNFIGLIMLIAGIGFLAAMVDSSY